MKYCSSECQTEDWVSHTLICKNAGAAHKEELIPLMRAAHDGDMATVRKLLEAGAKVDGDAIYSHAHETPMLTTLLFTAAAAGKAAGINKIK